MTDNDLVNEFLDRWEEARDDGRTLLPEELCREAPHLLPAVRAQIERLQKLDRMLDEPTVDWEITTNAEDRPVDQVDITGSFGNFRLIDSGGLGHVYDATDRELHRDAAVKFLQRRHLASPETVDQFRKEAEITGRLDHPGVVSVYGFGRTAAGQPFYAMQRIHGDTLADRVQRLHQAVNQRKQTAEDRVQFRQLLSSFVTVCRTMMYAHRRGVVHADLKPKNIVIGKHGETMVLDWGLAATIGKDEHHQDTDEATLRLGDSSWPTSSSAAGGGTLGYMSPEQHSGLPASTSSDIYALGATMFFILTGKSAFNARQALPTLRAKVIRGDFPPPRTVNREVPPALNSICLRAMALVPTERYQTADQLADDVERFFADEPVVAHEESIGARTRRWLRHHREVAQLIVIGTLAIIMGLTALSAITSSSARREYQAKLAATRARNHSLVLAAQFASESVGRRLSERWRILEFVAADGELTTMLDNIEQDRDAVEHYWTALNAHLRRTKDKFDGVAGNPDSWFICDATGRQVARIPESRKSIGKHYARRDYFHGNGRDLPDGEVGNPFHIEGPHKSQAYVSTSTGLLKIALTVPIWSHQEITPDRKFLGIVGMSVSLGEFHELQVNLQPGQNIIVVDHGVNYLDDQPRQGLVLYHPEMKALGDSQEISAGKLSANFYQLDETALQTIMEAIQQQHLIEPFRDPVAESGMSWVAACCEVLFKGQDAEASNWVVIVAECTDALTAE